MRIFESVVPGKSYLAGHLSRRMEEDEEALFLPAGAAWGRAQDMLTHGPVRLVLVGDSSRPEYHRLHRAALRVYAPHRVVLPLDSGIDAERISELGFPTRGDAALYACMGDRCLAPITTSQGRPENGPVSPLGQCVAFGDANSSHNAGRQFHEISCFNSESTTGEGVEFSPGSFNCHQIPPSFSPQRESRALVMRQDDYGSQDAPGGQDDIPPGPLLHTHTRLDWRKGSGFPLR